MIAFFIGVKKNVTIPRVVMTLYVLVIDRPTPVQSITSSLQDSGLERGVKSKMKYSIKSLLR
jgi:hypothetical protein